MNNNEIILKFTYFKLNNEKNFITRYHKTWCPSVRQYLKSKSLVEASFANNHAWASSTQYSCFKETMVAKIINKIRIML